MEIFGILGSFLSVEIRKENLFMLRDSLLEQNHRSTFLISWLTIVTVSSMIEPWVIAVY